MKSKIFSDRIFQGMEKTSIKDKKDAIECKTIFQRGDSYIDLPQSPAQMVASIHVVSILLDSLAYWE